MQQYPFINKIKRGNDKVALTLKSYTLLHDSRDVLFCVHVSSVECRLEVNLDAKQI